MRAKAPLLFLVGLGASCAAPTFGIEPRYGPVNISGDIGADAASVSANNSVEDAGIEDDDGTGSIRGDIDFGSPHLSFSFRKSVHDGEGTLSADLTQDGVTIPAGTDVVTDFDLGLHTAYLTFDVIPGDWELGFGLGLAAFDVDMRTTDDTGLLTVEFDEILPIPFLATRVGVGLWRIDLEGLVGFFTYSPSEDEEYSFFEVDASARVRLFGEGRASGWLTLGLRHTDVDLEYEDGGDEVAADLQISGPYFGLRIVL